MTLIHRGRPPTSSREILQDAAFELFLENSYPKTTVDQIAQRAGVSRATFFNYFPTKSDVFWVELDEALELLAKTLQQGSTERHASDGLQELRTSLLEVASQMGADRVPFALTQGELLGSTSDLQASALGRFGAMATLMTEFLESHNMPLAAARAAAYACLAASVSAAREWAEAGTSRQGLQAYMIAAIDPVVKGFRANAN